MHPTGDGLSRRHRRHVLATTAAETVACAPGSALAIPGISKGMPPPSSQPGIANHPPRQCCQGCLLQLPVAPLRMQFCNCETPNSQNLIPMKPFLANHVYLYHISHTGRGLSFGVHVFVQWEPYYSVSNCDIRFTEGDLYVPSLDLLYGCLTYPYSIILAVFFVHSIMSLCKW